MIFFQSALAGNPQPSACFTWGFLLLLLPGAMRFQL
jgi:hypothetical protein